MKGDITVNGDMMSRITHYFQKVYQNIFSSPVFMGPIVTILVIIVQDFILNGAYNLSAFLGLIKKYALVFIVLTNVFLHALFAGFGWLYRYDAYLLLLLYFTLIIIMKEANISKARSGTAAMSIIFVFLFLPFMAGRRMGESHQVIAQASKNIHDQQIQMSRFLKTYYNDAKVIANDIGAITYYTNIKLKDIAGLGSNDILVSRKMGERVNLGGWIMEGYNVIVVYDTWFGMARTKEDYEKLGLYKVAELYIEGNVICGGNPVSFITSDRTMVGAMRENMLKFKEVVPKDVTIVVF